MKMKYTITIFVLFLILSITLIQSVESDNKYRQCYGKKKCRNVTEQECDKDGKVFLKSSTKVNDAFICCSTCGDAKPM